MHPEQDTVPPFSLSQSQFTTVCVSCNAHLSSGGPDLDDPGRLPISTAAHAPIRGSALCF